MYVTIKYKYELTTEDDISQKDYEVEFDEELLELSNDEYDYIEQYLHLEDKEALDIHVDDMRKYFYECFDGVLTNVKVEEIPVDDFLDRLSFRLKHAICQRYAASIGLEFKSIRDENKHCRDKDFLIKAYEYALDFLEVKDKQFKKFENDSNELS